MTLHRYHAGDINDALCHALTRDLRIVVETKMKNRDFCMTKRM